MHNYTHEYTRKTEGKPGNFTHPLTYVGSRCSTDGCPDNRHPVTLPVVQGHNRGDRFSFFSPNSRVVKRVSR